MDESHKLAASIWSLYSKGKQGVLTSLNKNQRVDVSPGWHLIFGEKSLEERLFQ